MPPIRHFPMAAKPVKTERSHEENQERAYIAASRRSDRSLEARVESARRASEIHKRRTGRSLRVSEQDVVNEEMYEEEDDDLPLHYRKMQSQMNTSASDFNRRLATWLTQHAAMRTALGQAMNHAPAQNMPQWNTLQDSQQWNTFQNTFSNNGMVTPGFPQNPTMIPPSMMHRQSPSATQTPYPINTSQDMSNSDNQRPASTSAAPPVHGLSSPMSALNSPAGQVSQGTNLGLVSSDGNAQSPSSDRNAAHSYTEAKSHGFMSPPTNSEQASHGMFNMQQMPWPSSSSASPVSPLTTRLPPDAQGFFHNGMQFPVDGYGQQSTYSYKPNFASQNTSQSQISSGMRETLAPAAFEPKGGSNALPTPTSSEDLVSPLTQTDNNIDFGTFSNDALFSTNDFGQGPYSGDFGDGQPSPFADGFRDFINDDAYQDVSQNAP